MSQRLKVKVEVRVPLSTGGTVGDLQRVMTALKIPDTVRPETHTTPADRPGIDSASSELVFRWEQEV